MEQGPSEIFWVFSDTEVNNLFLIGAMTSGSRRKQADAENINILLSPILQSGLKQMSPLDPTPSPSQHSFGEKEKIGEWKWA